MTEQTPATPPVRQGSRSIDHIAETIDYHRATGDARAMNCCCGWLSPEGGDAIAAHQVHVAEQIAAAGAVPDTGPADAEVALGRTILGLLAPLDAFLDDNAPSLVGLAARIAEAVSPRAVPDTGQEARDGE